MKKVRASLMFTLVILSLILISQVVSAYDTTVRVKLTKDYNFSVLFNVNDPSEKITLQSLEQASNFQEIITFSYTSNVKQVDFYILAFMHGKIVKSKRFQNYTSGGIINLDLFETTPSSPATQTTAITGNAVQSINTTEPLNISSNSTLVYSNTSLSNQTISPESSFSLFSKINFNWKKIGMWAGIIIGAIIVIILLIYVIKFLISHVKRRSRSKEDIYPDRGREVFNSRVDKELIEAEKKIREAQEKIDSIMNRKNQLAEAEKKFEESKRELDRLKRL